MPFIPPMLPTLTQDPPAGDNWLHELKYDGYRTQLHVGSKSRAFTRNGHDWSHLYRLILSDAEKLTSDAVVDGEVIVQDDNGLSTFDALKSAITHQPERLIFVAFDLLFLNGEDLRTQAVFQRRRRLRDLCYSFDQGPSILFSEHVRGEGPIFFDQACELGCEGIVSKRVDSPYRSKRSRRWLKIKNMVESEFVVIGWQDNPGGPWLALLARDDQELLEYVGTAFVTLAEPQRERFWREMERLARITPPAMDTGPIKACWVTPELKIRARHLRCGGKLRHATLTAILENDDDARRS